MENIMDNLSEHVYIILILFDHIRCFFLPFSVFRCIYSLFFGSLSDSLYIVIHLYYRAHTHPRECYIKFQCQALYSLHKLSALYLLWSIYIYKTKPFPFTNSPFRRYCRFFFSISLVFCSVRHTLMLLFFKSKADDFSKSTWMLCLCIHLLFFYAHSPNVYPYSIHTFSWCFYSVCIWLFSFWREFSHRDAILLFIHPRATTFLVYYSLGVCVCMWLVHFIYFLLWRVCICQNTIWWLWFAFILVFGKRILLTLIIFLFRFCFFLLFSLTLLFFLFFTLLHSFKMLRVHLIRIFDGFICVQILLIFSRIQSLFSVFIFLDFKSHPLSCMVCACVKLLTQRKTYYYLSSIHTHYILNS